MIDGGEAYGDNKSRVEKPRATIPCRKEHVKRLTKNMVLYKRFYRNMVLYKNMMPKYIKYFIYKKYIKELKWYQVAWTGGVN